MFEFKHPSEIVGKTVANVMFHRDRLVILFADNSLCGVEGSTDSEDFPCLSSVDKLLLEDEQELGLITDEEYEERLRQLEIAYEKARREQRREAYERLRKEFEGV